MALPKLLQKLFQNDGVGPLLRSDIMPIKTVDGYAPDATGNVDTQRLPLSGGTMMGPIALSIHKLLACRDVNNSDLTICGGTDADNGAYIQLYGKYSPDNTGYVLFRATDANSSAGLCLKPSGEFELNGVCMNRYSMPKYDSVINFSSTEYVAPKDGWIFFAGTTADVNNWTGIYVDGIRVSSVTSWQGAWAGTTFQIAFPVTKGAKVTGLGVNGISVSERLFVPMHGV